MSWTWTRIAGEGENNSWDWTQDTLSLCVYNGNLFAGMFNPNELWSFNGSTWTKIEDYRVVSMVTHGGYLYFGTDGAKLFQYDGSNIVQIGGDELNSSWGTDYNYVQTLASDNTNLYAGLSSGADDAEVWQYSGGSWSKIGGDGVNSSWVSGYEYVKSLCWHDSKLYAGLGSGSGDAELWEYSGGVWAKIGGDGTGWGSGYEYVQTLASDGVNLYAGLGSSTGDAEVWQYSSSTWLKIGGDGVNSSWTGKGSVLSLLPTNSGIFAGLGFATGWAQIWFFDGSIWSHINSSWSTEYEDIAALCLYQYKLIAGIGSWPGDGEIWEGDAGVDLLPPGESVDSFNGNLLIWEPQEDSVNGWLEVRISLTDSFNGNLEITCTMETTETTSLWFYNDKDSEQSPGYDLWGVYLGIRCSNRQYTGQGNPVGQEQITEKWCYARSTEADGCTADNQTEWTQIGGDPVTGSVLKMGDIPHGAGRKIEIKWEVPINALSYYSFAQIFVCFHDGTEGEDRLNGNLVITST